MSTQDDFDVFLSRLRPSPAPDAVLVQALAAAKAMTAARAAAARSVPSPHPVHNLNQLPMISREQIVQHFVPLQQLPPNFAMPPTAPSPIIGPLHLSQSFPTLPMSDGPSQLSGLMVTQDGPVVGGIVFASVNPPVQEPQGVYPWPCGRTISQSDFNDRLQHARARIAAAIPLLDNFGPVYSSKACTEIIQTLLIAPSSGLSELRDQRDRLGAGSALGARLDTLIACAETIEDFQPFVEGMSSFLAELSDTGDITPTEYPCEVAKGKLKGLVGGNPGLVGARLVALAATITPSNGTSRGFLQELKSIGDLLSRVGVLPTVPLPGMSQDDIAAKLTLRLLELYGRLINGSFCDCPAPGSNPLA